jgi:uncharacterized membrane protein
MPSSAGQLGFFLRSLRGAVTGWLFASIGAASYLWLSIGLRGGDANAFKGLFLASAVVSFGFVFLIGGMIHFFLQASGKNSFTAYALTGVVVGLLIYLILTGIRVRSEEYLSHLLLVGIFVVGSASAATGFRLGFGEIRSQNGGEDSPH